MESLLSPFIHSQLLPALSSLEMASPPVLSEILVRRQGGPLSLAMSCYAS